MSLGIGTLTAFLKLDDSGFGAKLAKATADLKSNAEEMRGIGETLGLVGAGLAAVAAEAVKSASHFTEISNVISIAFGENAEAAEVWADKQSAAMGRSRNEFRDFGGQFQSLLAPVLASQNAAAGMSEKLVELGADLGSFYNVADSDALQALESGLEGMERPLRRFGVMMSQASLDLDVQKKGLGKHIATMSQAAQITERYNFILEHTKLQQGDAARTLGSFANQMKVAEAHADGLATQLGQPLMNALAPVLEAVNKLLGAFQRLDPQTVELIAKVALAAFTFLSAMSGALLLGGAIGGIVSILPEIVGGFAVLATTILPVVAIVAILVIIFGNLYNAWKRVGSGIGEGASEIAKTLKTMGSTVYDVMAAIAEGVTNVFLAVPTVIVKSFSLVLTAIASLLGKAKPLLDKLGLSDLGASALAAAENVTSFESDMSSALENVRATMKDVLNPAQDLIAALTSPDLSDAVRYFGQGISDTVVDGLKGAKQAVIDLLGVTGTDAALKTAKNTPNQPFDASGTPEAHGTVHEQSQKFEKLKLDTASTFGEAVRLALEKAIKDPYWWNRGVLDFTRGLTDGLEKGLKAIGLSGDEASKRSGEFGDSIFAAATSDRGKAAGLAGAQGLDSLLGGNFDLGALGGVIGGAAAGPIGGTVGKAIADGLEKMVSGLANAVLEGVSSMARTIGGLLFGGAKNTSAIGGAVGTGVSSAVEFAKTAAAAVALTGVLYVLVVGVLPALIAGMLPVVVGFTILATALTILLAPLIALDALLAGTVGLFVALLAIGTMTKSFERFSLALEWGARKIILGVEPLFAHLMPVADILLTLLIMFGQLAAELIEMLYAAGAFSFLFDALKMAAQLVLAFASGLIWGLLQLTKAFADIAAAIGANDLATALGNASDGLSGMYLTVKGAQDALKGMTLDSAAAGAANAAAAEKLAEAATQAGNLNLPERFKVAAARAHATLVGVGDDNYVGGDASKKAPVVNVYINGKELQDIIHDVDGAGRFRAMVAAGIPMNNPTSGRRKWSTPKRGNG